MKTVTYDENEWQLVPKKATAEMRDGLRTSFRRDCPSDELCNVRWASALGKAPQPPAVSAEPVAWRIFDGEGGYDFRSFENNESYFDDFKKLNPALCAEQWVEPLYLAPQSADAKDAARCVELQISNDGLWAHFRVGNGYAYSQNLSADRMSKRFADEYIAAMQKGGA